MYNISHWYNNYQAPSVLMIDDLSDVYIAVNSEESYKNDWGYLCNEPNSAFTFLENKLLNQFPHIKISFYVPYARHEVPNENSKFTCHKYAIGERSSFTNFLKSLRKKGHEIAHHGSNHGQYLDKSNLSSGKENFKHEWELFNNVQEGVKITLKGVEIFKKEANINIVGGKFCGYVYNEIGLDIIDECNFLYWCNDINFATKSYSPTIFGKNTIINFPTNFTGNAFVRLSYKTGNKQRDKKKNILKYFQPLYNLYSYKQLHNLYKNKEIISIQEHISPSTTSGNIQSANIVSDQKSLNKIYSFLEKKSIWYATAQEIAHYIYVRDNISINIKDNSLILLFNNYKSQKNNKITIDAKEAFALSQNGKVYKSKKNNNRFCLNLTIQDGENIFEILGTIHA